MQPLIKRLFLFCVFFVVLQACLFVLFKTKHKFIGSKDYYSKEFNAAFTNLDFDVIAIGNSKQLASFDKPIFEEATHLKTANLGCYTASISLSRLTLESYLEQAVKKPQFIFLEVSWFTFNNNRTVLHDLSGDLLLQNPSLLRYSLRYWPLFAKNYTSAVLNQLYIYKNPSNEDFSFRIKAKSPLVKTYAFNKAEFETAFPSHMAGVDPVLYEDFLQIQLLCIQNGIKLILYTAPEDRDYSLMQFDHERVKQIFKNTVKRSNNFAYFDYTLGGKFYDPRFELWLNDSHHINNRGLFTRKFIEDIGYLLKN